MKTQLTMKRAFYALASTALFLAACTKEQSNSELSDLSAASTIAVSASASSATTDTVYIVGACRRDDRREEIQQSALVAATTNYITANYPAAVFHRAFIIKDRTGATAGYVVIVFVNDKPVGLRFDASGSFVAVLEQRDRGDLNGPGFHRGGHFEHRDGQQRDTIALASLATSITSYLALNFAGDTLVKAFNDRNGNIVVLSKNNGLFATVFTSTGVFVKREQLTPRRGPCETVEQSALPAIALSYLSTTYPNYVFKKAFAIKEAGVVKAYVVVIDANNTKYAVEFDATGVFVRVKVIY